MIARLSGSLIDRDGARAIIDVHGVGWEVFAPDRAIAGWLGAERCVVHVSTQVREDAITLYGFATDVDRRAFEALLAVSGVGPKTALAALDAMDVPRLVEAVERDDVLSLSKISGVGKKTAQRLALELKGKLPVVFAPVSGTPTPVKAPPAEDQLPLALARLGFVRSEIQKAVDALVDQGVAADAPVSDRLAAALRILSAR
jgi:Holliday junction DNA helicase RuvA